METRHVRKTKLGISVRDRCLAVWVLRRVWWECVTVISSEWSFQQPPHLLWPRLPLPLTFLPFARTLICCETRVRVLMVPVSPPLTSVYLQLSFMCPAPDIRQHHCSELPWQPDRVYDCVQNSCLFCYRALYPLLINNLIFFPRQYFNYYFQSKFAHFL